MESSNTFSTDNPVVKDFLFYSCVLILKMMMIVPLVTRARLKYGVYLTEEDYTTFADGKPKKTIEAVERPRRNHLNDMENVIPFIFIGCCYCFTSPSHITALWFFRIFTASRIVHTIAYQGEIQPLRFYSFLVGFLLTVVMAIICIINFI